MSALSPSYPSGHTFQAKLVCEVLGNKYVEHNDYLQKLAHDVELSRLYLGLHFQSDNDFALVVAQKLLVLNPLQRSMEYEFNLTPIGKPRMTQRDKWLNPPREAILKYRLSKQAMETYAMMTKFSLKDKLECIFYLPMPESWSNKKKKEWL